MEERREAYLCVSEVESAPRSDRGGDRSFDRRLGVFQCTGASDENGVYTLHICLLAECIFENPKSLSLFQLWFKSVTLAASTIQIQEPQLVVMSTQISQLLSTLTHTDGIC